MSVRRTLRALGGDLLDLFAPRTCVACRAPHPGFPPPWPTAAPLPPALCAPCAAQLEPPCAPPPGVLAAYEHGGALARAVHRAKYGRSPAAARQLGALLRHGLGARLPAADCALPVPLHPRRLAARGFNQAVELARALGLPLALDAVRRTRDTASQVGLPRAARLTNVRGAFAPRRPGALAGARVLLVDDVVTTGATLGELAAAARAAGARAVVACAVLARAPLEAAR